MKYWLIKSEPAEYSIDDLARDKATCWDGVRNYQARNFMRDDMHMGDEVLFYHSSTASAGVVGLARVVRAAYSDHTALDRKNKHFDPKSTKEAPIWMMVDIEFVEKFPNLVTLEAMKKAPALEGMGVLQRGQRLSVMPVTKTHFNAVRKMGRAT